MNESERCRASGLSIYSLMCILKIDSCKRSRMPISTIVMSVFMKSYTLCFIFHYKCYSE